MHVAWCCVSVLKSDPKIPKSRARRQNLVATDTLTAFTFPQIPMITSSFSSVSRCNSLKTENFLSIDQRFCLASPATSAGGRTPASGCNCQYSTRSWSAPPRSDHNLQIFFTQMLCYFSGEPGLTSGPLIHFFLMMMVLVLLNITMSLSHYV